MRTILLFSILCLAAAGAVTPDKPLPTLGAAEELPYCGVLIDQGKDDQPKWIWGFYYAPLGVVLAGDEKSDLFVPAPYTGRILKVVLAPRKPFPMPAYVRRCVNDSIGQHNRELQKGKTDASAP